MLAQKQKLQISLKNKVSQKMWKLLSFNLLSELQKAALLSELISAKVRLFYFTVFIYVLLSNTKDITECQMTRCPLNFNPSETNTHSVGRSLNCRNFKTAFDYNAVKYLSLLIHNVPTCKFVHATWAKLGVHIFEPIKIYFKNHN